MKKKPIALHAAVIDYLTALERAGSPASTRKQHRSVLLRLTRHCPGRQYGGITTACLSGFLYGPEGITLGLSQRTAGAYRGRLRSFFRYGEQVGWGASPVIPEPAIRVRARRPSPPPTRLAPAEFQLMLDRAPSRILRGMVAVGLFTGLRISDIAKIRMRDVDLAGLGIYVQIQKTGECDVMPVTLELEWELRSYLQWYTEAAGVTLDSDACLFPGLTRGEDMVPGRPISYLWAHKHLRELYADCGIRVQKREAWHVIRRSVARMYFDARREDISRDHALRETAALLGHRNVATTEDYLGFSTEIEARNESMRGKRFLPAQRPVTSLPRRGGTG